MSISTIEAKTRQRHGTGGSRAVRREGRVPAVIYGGNKDPVSISLDLRVIEKDAQNSSFFSKLYELNIDGKKERVLPRDVQYHIINELPMHIDFLRVSKKDTLNVNVPLHFINEDDCPGMKKGGVLNIVLHEIELSCPADSIPESLDIDLTGLDLGESIHLEGLTLPAGVSVVHADRDNTLATIVAPSSVRSASEKAADEAAEVEAAEAAEAEGEAAAETDSAE